jgi:hypothetical protein
VVPKIPKERHERVKNDSFVHRRVADVGKTRGETQRLINDSFMHRRVADVGKTRGET